MRKIIVVTVFMMFVVAPLALSAATLAGVTLPDSAQVAGQTLVLNWVGLRPKFVVKVYVGGQYLEHKSSDSNKILQSDASKQRVMPLVRDVSKGQMTDAFEEGLKNNSPENVYR